MQKEIPPIVFTDMSMKPVRIKKTFPELFDIYSSYAGEKLF